MAAIQTVVRKTNSGFRQFTLIEMLIVIAIIGILAAMLMPSLQGALESSRQIGCANNLKNMYMGLDGYLSEHVGWLPYYANSNQVDTGFQNGPLENLLAPYLGVAPPTSSTYFPVHSEIFVCPSSPIRFTFDGTYYRYSHEGVNANYTNAYEGMQNHWGKSVAWTSSSNSYNNPDYIRFNRYKYPTRMPYQFCSRRGSPVQKLTSVNSGTVSNDVMTAASWHGNSSELCPRPTLFFDGHMKILHDYLYTAHGMQLLNKESWQKKPDVYLEEY